MSIADDDFIHGAALTAIADSPRSTLLNRATRRTGHYVVNNDRHLLIKYTKKDGPSFSFTFNPDDKRMLTDYGSRGKIFAVLVCGHEFVTALSAQQVGNIIDLDVASSQTVYVIAEPGQMLAFRGSSGELSPIPRDAFPECVLQ